MALSQAYYEWEEKTVQQAEQRVQQEIALELLRRSLPVEEVAEITKLSLPQVQQLQEQLARD